ncbi:MAG TPA: hypothetical protein VK696_02150 [Steroidobacteraceae bacterium]|jgi:hypothetical protein|nr:hypothetical protein [Steroidobacteraceae bacterium]
MRPDLEPSALLERLRDLPAEPPPYDYSEFSHRYSRRRRQQSQRPLRLLALALVVMGAGWLLRHGVAPWLGEVATLADAPLPPPPPDREPGGPPLRSAVLLPTVNAEDWLTEHPRQALVKVPAQMAVTELEDQIATIDDQLNAERLASAQAKQLTLLQRDRAQLVESLAQVRYAQNLISGMP